MGKGVGVVPPQLLGGEVANAALGEELGQLPGEAKGIGQPGDRAGPADTDDAGAAVAAGAMGGGQEESMISS